jgi:hypothetical protein
MSVHVMKAVRRVGIVGAATVGLVAVQAGGAAAAISVDMAEHGTLLARGAAVAVTVQAACDPVPNAPFPIFSSVSVGVSQRVGRRAVTGGGNAPITCDGQTQTVTVHVVPSSPFGANGVFKRGVAFASASVFGPLGPGPVDSGEITLVRT